MTDTRVLEGLCLHRPALFNRWCPTCDALIVAAAELAGSCGHIRRFPPGLAWAPRSWCSACERFDEFGVAPVEPPTVWQRPPFWLGEFATTPKRPLVLLELGQALRWPNVRELSRRLGMNYPRNWYRWRDRGLSFELADRLAINAGLHPIEVWGADWEAGT